MKKKLMLVNCSDTYNRSIGFMHEHFRLSLLNMNVEVLTSNALNIIETKYFMIYFDNYNTHPERLRGKEPYGVFDFNYDILCCLRNKPIRYFAIPRLILDIKGYEEKMKLESIYMADKLTMNTVCGYYGMGIQRKSGRTLKYSELDVSSTIDLFKKPSYVIDISNSIENVIFNEPATIILWADGTKTVVKTQDGEEYDPEKGLAMAICKKMLGNKHDYYNTFKKWNKKYEKENKKDES